MARLYPCDQCGHRTCQLSQTICDTCASDNAKNLAQRSEHLTTTISNSTCPSCNVPLAQHTCPQRVGTVPAVISATTGKLVRATSSRPTCGRCGHVHHNERGTALVCTASATARHFNTKVAPNDPNFYALVTQFLAHEAQTSQTTVATRQIPPPAPVSPLPIRMTFICVSCGAPTSGKLMDANGFELCDACYALTGGKASEPAAVTAPAEPASPEMIEAERKASMKAALKKAKKG